MRMSHDEEGAGNARLKQRRDRDPRHWLDPLVRLHLTNPPDSILPSWRYAPTSGAQSRHRRETQRHNPANLGALKSDVNDAPASFKCHPLRYNAASTRAAFVEGQ